MEVKKLYFDGKNNGRIVVVTHDDSEYEQTQIVCTDCGGVARLLKPLTGADASKRLCTCSTKH